MEAAKIVFGSPSKNYCDRENPPWKQIMSNTLWLFNIAMENGPFTDDFPSYINLHL